MLSRNLAVFHCHFYNFFVEKWKPISKLISSTCISICEDNLLRSEVLWSLDQFGHLTSKCSSPKLSLVLSRVQVVLPLEPHIIEICSQQDVSTNRECIYGVEVNACYSSLDCGGDRACIQGVCTPLCACTDVEQEICEGKLLSVCHTQRYAWY